MKLDKEEEAEQLPKDVFYIYELRDVENQHLKKDVHKSKSAEKGEVFVTNYTVYVNTSSLLKEEC